MTRKTTRRTWIFGGLFALVILIAAIGSGKPAATTTPTAAPAVTTTTPKAPAVTRFNKRAWNQARQAAESEATEATVNPIWQAESTSACSHEVAATGTVSVSCITIMGEVCNTPIDEASPAIVSAEEELKSAACKMEAVGNAQNNSQESNTE